LTPVTVSVNLRGPGRPRLLDLFCGAGGAALGYYASPPCQAYSDTKDKRKKHYGKTDEWRDFVTVTGHGT